MVIHSCLSGEMWLWLGTRDAEVELKEHGQGKVWNQTQACRLNGNSCVISRVTVVTTSVSLEEWTGKWWIERRKGFPHYVHHCVSQSGKVPRCLELGNSRGRTWGSWRLESDDQSQRNGMEVDCFSIWFPLERVGKVLDIITFVFYKWTKQELERLRSQS